MLFFSVFVGFVKFYLTSLWSNTFLYLDTDFMMVLDGVSGILDRSVRIRKKNSEKTTPVSVEFWFEGDP